MRWPTERNCGRFGDSGRRMSNLTTASMVVRRSFLYRVWGSAIKATSHLFMCSISVLPHVVEEAFTYSRSMAINGQKRTGFAVLGIRERLRWKITLQNRHYRKVSQSEIASDNGI